MLEVVIIAWNSSHKKTAISSRYKPGFHISGGRGALQSSMVLRTVSDLFDSEVRGRFQTAASFCEYLLS